MGRIRKIRDENVAYNAVSILRQRFGITANYFPDEQWLWVPSADVRLARQVLKGLGL